MTHFIWLKSRNKHVASNGYLTIHRTKGECSKRINELLFDLLGSLHGDIINKFDVTLWSSWNSWNDKI